MKIHLLFLVIFAVIPATSFARVNFGQVLSENQQEQNINLGTLKNSLNEASTGMKPLEERKRVVLHEKSEFQMNQTVAVQD